MGDNSDRGEPPSRRRFLEVATCAIGGGVGLAVIAPALRMVVDPAGKQTVTRPDRPFDLGPPEQFVLGAPPRRVELVAPVIQDAWTAARDVVIGAAWIRRTGPEPGALDAWSAVCPHLGCAIGWDGRGQEHASPGSAGARSAAEGQRAGEFVCPCHDSRFAVDGAPRTGPAERGLDPLPVQVVEGRLALTWVRYRLGGATREPA
jgi:menaquinol-cytochrome c reductase iron-sulfur subunit